MGKGGNKQGLEYRGEAGVWLSGPQAFHAMILSRHSLVCAKNDKNRKAEEGTRDIT